jgi:hypothetical protein
MKLIAWFSFLVGAVAIQGCTQHSGAPEDSGVPGSGIAETEIREVGIFDGIKFKGEGRLEVTVGAPTPLEITADDNLLALLTTEVTGEMLVIEPTERIDPITTITIKVGAESVASLNVAGACETVITGIDSEAFKFGAAGAVKATLSGQSRELFVSTTGGAEITAHELVARSVTVSITGAGDMTVHATETLDVGITGAGNVRYAGAPTVSKRLIGGGSVEKRE